MEQLITIIGVKRREPLTGNYVKTGLEIGWAKEVPPTPEERAEREIYVVKLPSKCTPQMREYLAKKYTYPPRYLCIIWYDDIEFYNQIDGVWLKEYIKSISLGYVDLDQFVYKINLKTDFLFLVALDEMAGARFLELHPEGII